MTYKFFDKKSAGSGVKSTVNQQLADNLHKQIIRKLKRHKFYSYFIDNIWGADVADTTKDLDSFYALIFLANMVGLLL